MLRCAHDVGLFFFGCAKRHCLGIEVRLTHIHAHQIIVGHAQHHAPGLGTDANIALVGQAFQPYKAGKAASAVTALRHFTAVGVKNAVMEIQFRIVRRFYHQQLVKANAQVPIGQTADQLG
ncbi:hypothetical protein D3C86_1638120 [compost metagenome]